RAPAAAPGPAGRGARRPPGPRGRARPATRAVAATPHAPRALAPRWVVPAGGRLRATLGNRTRLTLVGPGEAAASTVGEVTELELASGRLLVDYDGRGGGKLRIRSPGAVTTVTGTLFAVEVRGRTSRVAVARG